MCDINSRETPSSVKSSRRKIRRTEELIAINLTLNMEEERQKHRQDNLLKSSSKKKQDVLPAIVDTAEEPSKRRFIKAKRILSNKSQISQKSTDCSTSLSSKTKSHDNLQPRQSSQASAMSFQEEENYCKINNCEKTEIVTATMEDGSLKEELSAKKERKKWILPSRDSNINKPLFIHQYESKDISNNENSSVISINDTDDSLELMPSVCDDFKNVSSEEQKTPSTSGSVSLERRRTFELEKSITDVSILKIASMRDSDRMSQTLSAVKKYPQSKVTLRRRGLTQRSFSDSEEVLDRTNATLPDHVTPPKFAKRHTSTPKSAKRSSEKSLLKQVLINEESKPVVNNDIKSKKTKMPNFALIHQKALDKLENISQYQERKNARAQLLLSGKKPLQDTSLKKNVTFSKDTVEKPKDPLYIPLPNTPMVKKKYVPIEYSPEAPAPIFKFAPPGADNKIFHFKLEKPPVKFEQRKILTPKIVNIRPEVNRFGFRATTKEDAKTMIMQKTQQASSKLEKRRDFIKGVRSNRRFELLMKMRKGK